MNKSTIFFNELFSWIDKFISLIPGLIGYFFRKKWFSFRFKKGSNVSIGTGCTFISPQTMEFSKKSSIGRNSFFCSDGGEIIIGVWVAFNTNVHINSSLGGKIIIGDNVMVGPNVVMRTANHKYDNLTVPMNIQGHTVQDITIEDNVWIAANVVVLGGVKIGTGSIIAAGSVVTKDIEANVIAGGIPAKILRKRNE